MRKHRIRTAEQVVVAYAEAVAEVRRMTNKIGSCQCIRVKGWEVRCAEYWREHDSDPYAHFSEPSPDSCLYDLFHASTGPEGEVHPATRRDLHAAMCSPCSEAYEYIQTRKTAKLAVGAAKRACEAVGKRIKAQVAQ